MLTRIFFVWLAKNASPNLLSILGYLALLPAFGFIYIYIFGKRKTGAEVFGDKIWWNNLRPIHAIFYLLFAYNAIQKNMDAWIYLLLDVILGFVSFVYFHYQQGNFS